MSQLFWTNGFRDRLREIGASDRELGHRLGVSIAYLGDFGRSAVAPDVKWRLATSQFVADSGEIRWPDPEYQTEYPDQAWRGLFVAATDTSWILFTVLGNKAGQPDWYDTVVAESDRQALGYRAARNAAGHPLTNFPPSV